MLNKLKKLFKRTDKVQMIANNQRASDAHMIALARLAFIKPEQLVREAQNHKKNAEYLLKMVEAKQKGKK